MNDRIKVVIGNLYRTRSGKVVKVAPAGIGSFGDTVALVDVKTGAGLVCVYSRGPGAGTGWSCGTVPNPYDLMVGLQQRQLAFDFSVA